MRRIYTFVYNSNQGKLLLFHMLFFYRFLKNLTTFTTLLITLSHKSELFEWIYLVNLSFPPWNLSKDLVYTYLSKFSGNKCDKKSSIFLNRTVNTYRRNTFFYQWIIITQFLLHALRTYVLQVICLSYFLYWISYIIICIFKRISVT